PTRSQKRTVSCRRSPAGGAGPGSPPGVETALARASVVSRAPQPPQNCSSGWFEAPHDAQGAASAAPHFPQNRRSARLSWLQDGQRIAACLAPGDYHAGLKPRNSPPGESSAGRNQGIQPRRPPSGPGHGAIRQAPTSQLNPSRRPEPDPQLLPIPPVGVRPRLAGGVLRLTDLAPEFDLSHLWKYCLARDRARDGVSTPHLQFDSPG